jgi:hypothetical protein
MVKALLLWGPKLNNYFVSGKKKVKSRIINIIVNWKKP